MKRRNVMASLLVAAILLSSVAAGAAQSFEEKFDSLFMIASSGSIRFQEMVGPAMDSIAAMGAGAVPLLVGKYDTWSARERVAVSQIIQKIGTAAVPQLIGALDQPDPLMLARVVSSLGDVGDSTAVAPLAARAGHERWHVRSAVITALGQIGDSSAAAPVMAALSDTIGLVRKSAVVACGRIGLERSMPELVHLLGDEFFGARLMAVESLCGFTDTAAVIGVLRDSLGASNELVGHLACVILGRFGTDPALQLLFEQTAAGGSTRRAFAAEALLRADPTDLCGFREIVLERETDPEVRLLLRSVQYDIEHGRP